MDLGYPSRVSRKRGGGVGGRNGFNRDALAAVMMTRLQRPLLPNYGLKGTAGVLKSARCSPARSSSLMPRPSKIGPAKGRVRSVGRVLEVVFLFVLGTGLMAVGVFSGAHTGPHDYVVRAVLFILGFITIVGAWDVLVWN